MTKNQAKELIAFKQKFTEASALYSISKEPTMMPYTYGDALTDFIQFCYANNLVSADYQLIQKELNNNRTNAAWFAALPEEKVIQCIGWFIRGDRFCDGLLFSAVTDGTVLRLIERIKALYDI